MRIARDKSFRDLSPGELLLEAYACFYHDHCIVENLIFREMIFM